MAFTTHSLGFPRIGFTRELKFATEKFWQASLSEAELLKVGKEIRRRNWELQKEKGIQLIPSNDFSFYDQNLDTIALYGVVPDRFEWDSTKDVDLATYFAMARGVQEKEVDQSGQVVKKSLCTF
jgi:5-methyltetrahydropteroyltriglutamate--homocysteine methyltransferase